MSRSQADIGSQQATITRRGTPPDVNCFITRSKPLKSLLPLYKLCNIVTWTQVHSNYFILQNDSSTHPIIMYITKLKIHVPVVPLVETQLIKSKCLQAEQITFFPSMEGLNSCITCLAKSCPTSCPTSCQILTILTILQSSP